MFDFDPDCWVSAADLGEFLGIHERQVRKLAERAVIQRNGRGRYRLRESVRAVAVHLREQAAGRAAEAGDDDNPDLTRERALLARAQRDGHLMRNAILRGELLPVEDTEAVVGAMLDATRAKMLAIPTKGASALVGVTSLVEAREKLTELVYDACGELAATPVAVSAIADRARRRVGRSSVGDEAAAEDGTSASSDGQRVG